MPKLPETLQALRGATPQEPPAPVRVVVTRNYRRETANPYLVRPLTGTEAEETPNLVLTDAKVTLVEHDPRFRVERSFGCGVIIVGDQSPAESVPEGAVQIRFDGSYFVRHDNGRSVHTASVMYFTPDGIFALQPK